MTTASNGAWVGHGGQAPDIQVVNCRWNIVSPGSTDDSRSIGAILDVDDIWYYAIEFAVDVSDNTTLNKDYFIHFKDNTDVGFNACLKLEEPNDSTKDYSLSILSSSESENQSDWNGDFNFGERVVAVVRWNNGTGAATLWVNPPLEKNSNTNSENITHLESQHAMRAVESLALRQSDGPAGSSSIVIINRMAVGPDFGVLLAVSFDLLIFKRLSVTVLRDVTIVWARRILTAYLGGNSHVIWISSSG